MWEELQGASRQSATYTALRVCQLVCMPGSVAQLCACGQSELPSCHRPPATVVSLAQIRRVEDLGIPSELIEAEDPWRLPRPLNFDPAAVHAAAASQWLRGGFDWQLHAYMLDRLTTVSIWVNAGRRASRLGDGSSVCG